LFSKEGGGEMKEKPIFFSTPMVQAILDGRKTQTRRVIKPQPKYPLRQKNGKWHEYSENPMADEICNSPWGYQHSCLFVTGQRLWVREAFAKTAEGEYIYWADPIFDGCGPGDISWKWTSFRFMPREAARLFLEVKNVRAEKLQDVSEEDARTEGVKSKFTCGNERELKNPVCIENRNSCYVCAFKYSWDTLNAKRGYPWESNPWVWVIEFRRIEK
jgi:hypothetical protein